MLQTVIGVGSARLQMVTDPTGFESPSDTRSDTLGPSNRLNVDLLALTVHCLAMRSDYRNEDVALISAH